MLPFIASGQLMLPKSTELVEVVIAGKGISNGGWPTYTSNRGQEMVQATEFQAASALLIGSDLVEGKRSVHVSIPCIVRIRRIGCHNVRRPPSGGIAAHDSTTLR